MLLLLLLLLLYVLPGINGGRVNLRVVNQARRSHASRRTFIGRSANQRRASRDDVSGRAATRARAPACKYLQKRRQNIVDSPRSLLARNVDGD